MTLDELKTHCLSCTECELCKARTQVVFGVGNPAADILLIGEGPGENEDLQGQPFVGRSGKLLDQFLESIDLSREKNVYIANMVKCRPPKNRDPKPEEQEQIIASIHRCRQPEDLFDRLRRECRAGKPQFRGERHRQLQWGSDLQLRQPDVESHRFFRVPSFQRQPRRRDLQLCGRQYYAEYQRQCFP